MQRAAEANGYTYEDCDRKRRAGNMEAQTGYHYCLAVLADTSESEMRGLYAEACRPAGPGVGTVEEDKGKGKDGGKAKDGSGGRGASASGRARGRVRFEEQPSLSQWLLENTRTMACAQCRQFID